jgi:hypothetical protein
MMTDERPVVEVLNTIRQDQTPSDEQYRAIERAIVLLSADERLDVQQARETVLRDFIKDPYASGRFEVVDLELPEPLQRELFRLAANKGISIYYLAALYHCGRAAVRAESEAEIRRLREALTSVAAAQAHLRLLVENTADRTDEHGKGLHAAYVSALDLLEPDPVIVALVDTLRAAKWADTGRPER